MKKKLKLKSYVLPTIYIIIFITSFYLTLAFSNSLSQKISKPTTDDNEVYIDDSDNENEKPVINETEEKMIKPYLNEKVSIGKYFYDYESDSEKQQNSITYYDNTYMQNSGIDYINDETFEVVSVLNGTVSSVKNDELLGQIVEIKHDNDYISIYQSLSEVSVKKGDIVKQGQVIGKSGTNEMDKDMGNHLHFELYINGGVVNPELYIDKQLETTKKQDNNKTEE